MKTPKILMNSFSRVAKPNLLFIFTFIWKHECGNQQFNIGENLAASTYNFFRNFNKSGTLFSGLLKPFMRNWNFSGTINTFLTCPLDNTKLSLGCRQNFLVKINKQKLGYNQELFSVATRFICHTISSPTEFHLTSLSSQKTEISNDQKIWVFWIWRD